MPQINLTNITIQEKEDKNSNIYFLIINNDNPNEAFFCFERTVKEGWTDLVNNYQNIVEVELEYQVTTKGKKVSAVFAVAKGDIIV